MIQAASQYHKVEDCIFDALVEIPEAMEHARRYISIYSDEPDPFLERKTFDLYLAVLRALNQIMQFFADNQLRELFHFLSNNIPNKLMINRREILQFHHQAIS